VSGGGQLRLRDEYGAALQLDQIPPTLADLADDGLAERRDVNGIARMERHM
jgi:hypothetical protein